MSLLDRFLTQHRHSGRSINRAAKLLAPEGTSASPAQRRAYLRYTRTGDQLADQLVAMMQRLPTGEGRRLFETAVEHGIDAVSDPPVELVEFFAAVDEVPYWVDRSRLDLACRVLGRTGVLVGYTALSMAALLGGYQASRVAKTLVGTGDLTRMAGRRLAETTAWHIAVTTPGGLERSGEGFKATLRVRLMHAQVRAGMHRRPGWDTAAWDHPVNASQVAGTTMMFSLAHLTGCQAFGLTFTRRERDAVYHLWRYLGHLLGVPAQILPSEEGDHWRLMALQAEYEFAHPDSDSTRLAQALIQAIGPAVIGDETSRAHELKRQAIREIMIAYARLILGPSVSDVLQLPDRKSAQAFVIALAITIRTLEVPRRVIPGATRWSQARGRRAQLAVGRRMTARHSHSGYSRHDHLAANPMGQSSDEPQPPPRYCTNPRRGDPSRRPGPT